MGLIDVGNLDGFAHFEASGVGLLLTHDEAEKRGFAGSIGSYHADNACGREHEVEILEQLFRTEGFRQPGGFDHFVAQTRAVGDEYLQTFLTFALVFVEKSVVARQARLAFGLTRFRSHAHPFKFAFEGFAAFRGLFFLLCHAFGLLVEP